MPVVPCVLALGYRHAVSQNLCMPLLFLFAPRQCGSFTESPNGGLALEGLGTIRQFFDRADALVAGPGIGKEDESHALLREACKLFPKSILLDADALRPEIISKLKNKDQIVITPHEGELDRLLGSGNLEEFLSVFV